MDFAIVVVPVKVDFDIFYCCGVYRHIIVVFETVNQVVGITAGGVFDTKVLTPSVNWMGCVSCFHKPGTMWLC